MLVDQFIQFEDKNKLFELKIDEFPFWHIVRFKIYKKILENDENIGSAHTETSEKKVHFKIKTKLKQIPSWIFHNPFFVFKKRDILVLNHKRKVRTGKYFECIYTDELLKGISYSNVVIEDPMLNRHNIPVITKNIKHSDFITALSFIKRIKIKNKLEKNVELLKAIQEIFVKLENEFDVMFSKKWIENLIITEISLYKSLYPYFKFLIKKIKPKVIVEVVSYSTTRFVVNSIAKEEDIPTVELQHGTMGRFHLAYNFPDQINIKTFPDYIFTFGEYWNKNTRVPIDPSKIKIVGWPFYEKRKKEVLETIKNGKSLNINILFVSQGTIGKELSKIAVELSNMIKNKNYKIIYKLHPGEYDRWQKEYPWLIKSNIEVIDDNKHDIHYYFAKSKIQIGVYSTVLLEGLGYNLKTLIVKLYGHNYFQELYENGYALLVKDSVEIFNQISNANKIKEDFNYNYFWKDNGKKNMIKELEHIIENNGRNI